MSSRSMPPLVLVTAMAAARLLKKEGTGCAVGRAVLLTCPVNARPMAQPAHTLGGVGSSVRGRQLIAVVRAEDGRHDESQ